MLWKCKNKEFHIKTRPLVMGIINVTPDSFYADSRRAASGEAVSAALRMAEEGADIIDVGGESSRPGSLPVSEDEELRRVMPVVEALAGRLGATALSIDTTKSRVAEAALAAGAHIINDISAAESDPRMPQAIATAGAGAVLMHKKGEPRAMQENPVYENVLAEVAAYLEARLKALCEAGAAFEALAVDPGIGFGKTVRHNLALLAGLPALARLGRPVVVGVSRKSFLGKLTARESPADRLPASLSAAVYAALRGARVLRVHDVKETRDALAIAQALQEEEQNCSNDST